MTADTSAPRCSVAARMVDVGGMPVRRLLPARTAHGRRLVLPRPRRAGRIRSGRRHPRRPASAHRPADVHLDDRRRGAAQRQPRQPAVDPPGPGQRDDRRPRHQPRGGRAARPRRAQTSGCSCGSRCRMPNASARRCSSIAQLPHVGRDGFDITLLVGDWLGASSPATVFSPLLGADLLAGGAAATTRCRCARSSSTRCSASTAKRGSKARRWRRARWCFLGTGRETLRIETDAAARLLLLGGRTLRRGRAAVVELRRAQRGNNAGDPRLEPRRPLRRSARHRRRAWSRRRSRPAPAVSKSPSDDGASP